MQDVVDRAERERLLDAALRRSQPAEYAMNTTRHKLESFWQIIRGDNEEAAAKIKDELIAAIENEYTICRRRAANNRITMRESAARGVPVGFAAWLRRQRHKPDAVGVLAREFCRDPEFPKHAETPESTRLYAIERGADDPTLDVLAHAWEMYAR